MGAFHAASSALARLLQLAINQRIVVVAPMRSSSKGAVISLTRTLAQELGPFGITVNTIPPGSIRGTIMADANISDASADRLAATLPVRRVGRPEDIANACAFLCSEASSYVTGQLIGVNGGRVVS